MSDTLHTPREKICRKSAEQVANVIATWEAKIPRTPDKTLQSLSTQTSQSPGISKIREDDCMSFSDVSVCGSEYVSPQKLTSQRETPQKHSPGSSIRTAIWDRITNAVAANKYVTTAVSTIHTKLTEADRERAAAAESLRDAALKEKDEAVAVAAKALVERDEARAVAGCMLLVAMGHEIRHVNSTGPLANCIRWGSLTGGVLTAVHLIRRRHSRANSHTTASAMPGPTSCCPGNELWTLEDVTAVEAAFQTSDARWTVALREYLGRCGRVEAAQQRSVLLLHEDGKRIWWPWAAVVLAKRVSGVGGGREGACVAAAREANEAEFEHAAAYMRDASVAKKATQQQQLKLYALFKQASTGTCNTARPGMLDGMGRAKWDAWQALPRTLSAAAARTQYVQEVKSLCPDYLYCPTSSSLTTSSGQEEDPLPDADGSSSRDEMSELEVYIQSLDQSSNSRRAVAAVGSGTRNSSKTDDEGEGAEDEDTSMKRSKGRPRGSKDTQTDASRSSSLAKASASVAAASSADAGMHFLHTYLATCVVAGVALKLVELAIRKAR